MKKSILPIVSAGILFLSACTNDNSSTVATRDDEEQSSSSHSGSEGHEPAKEASSHTEIKKEENAPVAEDTSATHIRAGKASAGFETKQGKGASIDSSRIKVTPKKVKVDVKTRQ